MLRCEFTVQSFLNLAILGGVIHKNYVQKEQQNHLAYYHLSYTNVFGHLVMSTIFKKYKRFEKDIVQH